MGNKEIENKITEMITAIGAMGEFLGCTRDMLIKNGFTREEAVAMCATMLSNIVLGAKQEGEK